jgi:hypothetical protein
LILGWTATAHQENYQQGKLRTVNQLPVSQKKEEELTSCQHAVKQKASLAGKF